MSFYRKNWYYIGALLFVILAFFLGIAGGEITTQRRLLILTFMAMLMHQFEEYGLPGGFPKIWNVVMSDEKEYPERYPLNKQASLMVNTFCIYPVYILSILFPTWYWIGITLTLFGFAQLVVHGIIIPKKLHSFYNPGLAAVLFLMIPLGIYYLWYLNTSMIIPTRDWIIGVLGVPMTALLAIQTPMKMFQSKESPYPWSDKEMERFSLKK